MATPSNDFWVPTTKQTRELGAQAHATLHGYMERRMMADQAEEQAKRNSESKQCMTQSKNNEKKL